MKNKKYKITCNERQLSKIATAVEQYSRMICGQVGEAYMPSIEHGMMKEHYYKDGKKNMNHYCKVRDEVEKHLDEIKRIIWNMPPNAHYGVGYDEDADLGYETYKCILSQFEKEEMKKCEKNGTTYRYNVHTGTPLKLTDEPFIEIELIEEM